MIAQEKTKTKGFCLWDDFRTNANLLHCIPFYEVDKPISFGYRCSNIEQLERQSDRSGSQIARRTQTKLIKQQKKKWKKRLVHRLD